MRRGLLSSALVVAAVLGLAGCAHPGDPAATSFTCPEADTRLSEAALVADPRSVEGPSTACLPTAAIDSVVDDTAPALPVRVTDAEGRAVEVTDVDRILAVDIAGTIAATVFGLGLGDQVVGRDSSTGFPGTEDLPVVTTSGHTLNAEAILALEPTVVLTDTTIGPKEVRQQLRDAGIAVVVISSERRLDTVGDLVIEVATALGVPTRGAALAERLEAEIAAAEAEVSEVAPADVAERPRMLFLYARGSANVYYLFGRDSGADSLIESIGAVDVAGEMGWEGMKPMTAEALVAARPDVILMMSDGLESVGGVDGLIETIPAIAQTPAGVHRRVVDMDDTAILGFGPRSAEVVRALARALYAPADSSASPAS